MNPNDTTGPRSFAFHTGQWQATAASLADSANQQTGSPYKDLSPEAAARVYLALALSSQADGVKAFTAGPAGLPNGAKAEPTWELVGVEKLSLTNTQTVKFRQVYRGIPVYGSFVTVEMENDNELLSIDSALAQPDVDPVPTKSTKEAIDVIRKEAGYPDGVPLDIVPTLEYYCM